MTARRSAVLLAAVAAVQTAFAYVTPNYDETKVGPYELEDPLVFADGRRVATPADWENRRDEILGIFAREMYGRRPPEPAELLVELENEKVTSGGFALRRQYRMFFRNDRTGPCIHWIVWLPRHGTGRAPLVLFLNYRGNGEIVPDADITPMRAWCRIGDPGILTMPSEKEDLEVRGRQQDPNWKSNVPLGLLLARGYAVMSACYCEVSPDPSWKEPVAAHRQDPFAYTGVFGLWGARDPSRTDDVTALGAWAWALSRGLDLAERIPEIDATRNIVTGYSRLGKAALIAAARDVRFAVCAPVQTGAGGCPLSKRDFGENVSSMTEMFTHWYCRAFAKYAADPAELLTFDQHLFLSCIAPRGLLVLGFDDEWFDTKGEFLAAQAANPVWRFLGRKGMPEGPFPDDYATSAVGDGLGYARRTEGHGFAPHDWAWMLDFAAHEFAARDEAVRRDTAVLQRRIDDVAAGGGGTVLVPAGRHVVGGIFLRSNVTLHLEKGAVLEGFPDTSFYPGYHIPNAEMRTPWQALITATNASNVAVTGEGRIFGNGARFPVVERPAGRPRGLVFLNCRNVRVEGVTISDPACWSCYFRGCDGVVARDVTIDAHANYNNDGFDIDSVNVLIERCTVDAGDDGICLKSDDPDRPTENVEVRDCRVSSTCNALKIGTGSHGGFRNVVFHDCETRLCRRVGTGRPDDICRSAGYHAKRWPGSAEPRSSCSAIAIENVDGGELDGVTFRNIRAEGSRVPVFIRAGVRERRACGIPFGTRRVTRNILVENVTGRALSRIACSLTGVPGHPLRNVMLRNVEIAFPGGGDAAAERAPVPEHPAAYPEANMFDQRALPAACFYVRHAEEVDFENVRVSFDRPDAREPFVFDDVKGGRRDLRISGETDCPTVTMREKPAEFFHLMPQAGVTHLLTEDDLHNAIWDMAVSPEGRVFFGACGETFGSVYARMYEFLPDEKRLVRHFDLEKRLALDDVGLRTSKFHTSMSFLGGHKLLTTTHTTSPSPRHPVWMPYEYYNHKFEGFKGSDLLIWDYETNETKGLGKFTSHDTIYGATYDPKNGDYFGITCLLGRGYVYNLKDGSVRRLGQVTDSRASKTFLCSDGHIYGSTFSGAMFRYNTDTRDIEYLGLHVNGLLRQAHEWKGVLYFFTGTCGRPGCGMDFYAYDLKAGTLKNLGCPVPIADRLPQYRPDELPQYHAYGMTMDGEGRVWYGCHTVTPTIRYPGVRLFVWDFLHGGDPVDCGFLGTKVRTVSELADMRWLAKWNMLVITDGNHNSDKDDACGIVAIELDKFLPALADKSAPRLFSHDYTNYLPYPPSCWKHYPKDDWDACYARYLTYYRDVTRRFKRFAKDNAFRIPSEGASGVSVWERTGRASSAVRTIRWTSPTSFSFWTSGERTFRTDCTLDGQGRAIERVFIVDDLQAAEAVKVPFDTKAGLPAVPGRRYLAEASASVALDDGSVLVGTKDGMLARIAGGKARAEGNVMTSGPVLALAKSCDGSVWGVSAHDEGLGYVFRWTAKGGLELKGVPPDVTAPNGRNVHIYQPSAIAVSTDGRYVAVGGRDEIAGVTVFPAR